MQLGYFCNTKDQRGFISTLAFIASRRACRPTAVFSIQLARKPHQTGEPWHPSCHGGKTPAKPHVPLCPLPAFGGQSGVKGHCPLGERRELADVAEAEMLQKTIRGGVKNGTA